MDKIWYCEKHGDCAITYKNQKPTTCLTGRDCCFTLLCRYWNKRWHREPELFKYGTLKNYFKHKNQGYNLEYLTGLILMTRTIEKFN